MSYQALARQWRPKNFSELVGQAHVVTALQNALTRGRIHHAYLLTGTRGVGKTTLARILAKSLNCEQGVTATPCGQCAACTAIDEGRFVDLLELDAASNTGIDNMREILDNARYAPTVGRYKVYLIDEVHMLSKAAFNSMLKTLEEPPEHVKFVLATTDPQKIPVTVLSRCLQFSLKPLPSEEVRERLAYILEQEKIPFENNALSLIAHSARGSLRDALSLLDQAIAYGAGEVKEADVRTMLGTVERDYIDRLVEALAAKNGEELLAEADQLVRRGIDASAVLDELGMFFHRVAVAQVVPEAAKQWDDAEKMQALAARFSPEDVQLFYQITLQGRADLALAPDEPMGLSMTLLRLLAFAPTNAETSAKANRKPSSVAADTVKKKPHDLTADKAPVSNELLPNKIQENAPKIAPQSTDSGDFPAHDAASWTAWVAQLPLNGIAEQVAAYTEWRGIEGNEITLALPEQQRHFAEGVYASKLKGVLEKATGRRLRLKFDLVAAADDTLAAQKQRAQKQAQKETETAFRDDPFVQALEKEGGVIKRETINKI
jgi:DNA polymerase III, subunit gamma and tau